MTVERRKHARYEVQSRALASLSRSPAVAGHIINISESGLSFRYVASQQRSGESPRLNLLVSEERNHFNTLPFQLGIAVWNLVI